MIRAVFALVFALTCAGIAVAQADDICREFGETPTREVDRNNRIAPYIFGRIVLRGIAPNEEKPRITVIYSDSRQPATRLVLTSSGGYCFRRQSQGGVLIIEVDGVESVRKTVSDLAELRHREDFEITVQSKNQMAPPGVISTKFERQPNEKTTDLYKKAATAEAAGQGKKAVEFVKEIVAIDPDDFIAWAKLGSLLMAANELDNAEKAFKHSVELRPDYIPALLNIGIIHAFQNKYAEAIAIFTQIIEKEPKNARAHRFLGEAYLQNRQGTLGLATLDRALELDPIGMAECHLLKARLYDLVGAKNMATREYKQFLEKVPDYSEKKKLQKYIKENPDE